LEVGAGDHFIGSLDETILLKITILRLLLEFRSFNLAHPEKKSNYGH
jgi:hypothetical protein